VEEERGQALHQADGTEEDWTLTKPLTHLGSISSTFYEQLLRAQISKVQKDSQVASPFCPLGICQ